MHILAAKVRTKATMPLYGYARVSTRDHDLSSQDAELRAAGCAKVFREKASGAKTDRPELAKVIRRLEKSDVLVVVRLDRPGAIKQGSAQRARRGWQTWRRLPIAAGRTGRHHDASRQADADDPGRSSRV